MSDRDRSRIVLRARLLLAALLCGLGLSGARVVQLQVSRHEELDRLARKEYLRDIRVPARRGHIYDRDGRPLAISVDVPSVYANPSRIIDPRDSARRVAAVLEMDLDTAYQRLASDRLFVWLKRQVSPHVADTVRALGLPGVYITEESRRFYPNREIGAHLVGFTGVDGSGLEGIERQLDDELTGEPQVVAALRDRSGNAVLDGALDLERQTSGSDVRLTIDLQIQHAAQVALQTVVRTTGAKGGMAVVLDVPSAEILAMATEPVFNPNRASESPPAARRNRVVTDMFEPGSTFKPLVIAAALEEGVVGPDTRIFCENGALTIGSHTIGDSAPHGWLSLKGIVAKSSNPGAAKVGLALGRDKLAAALRRYGFGSRTGVSFPGETRGLVRDPATWSRIDTATISFGHGVAVSLLQLAAAHRVIASGGLYGAPVLVRSIESPGGRIEQPPRKGERRVLEVETAQQVAAMMEAAVGPHGTGGRAAVRGYRVAGKTGTAQKVDPVAGGYSDDRFIAAFAGFLPADAPRVVIAVAVDEPGAAHTGGAVAAPVFAEIGEAAMRYLGVVPSAEARSEPQAVAPAETRDPPSVEATARRAEVAAAPHSVPSFVGLTAREAAARFAAIGPGLSLQMRGSGRVVSQEPRAGRSRAGIKRVRLVLAQQ